MVKTCCWALFFTAAIILTVSGCKQDTGKDNSLPLREYRKSGMPDPDKTWHSHDFSLANAVLEDIKSKNPKQLPIKESAKSGLVFKRMLSMENMIFLHDESIPDGQKLSQAEYYLRVCENWMRLYTLEAEGEQYYHHELTDVYLFGLEITHIMLEINERPQNSDRFDESVNEIDPIQSIYLSGLFNLLREQSNSPQFAEEDHEILTGQIIQSITQNRSWMDDAMLGDLKQALQLNVENASSNDIKAKYQELLASL